jgi:hypothetical protein
MHKPNHLSVQLRESAPYLRDAGWRQTAELLIAAANEIDTLRAQVGASETRAPRGSEQRVSDQPVIKQRR